ncbi:MAG TPA: hypothetical protein VJ816_02370 [Gemmatimonadales bacterium]|nr:hypothetical protein [Gemmatimonadales bacterium]
MTAGLSRRLSRWPRRIAALLLVVQATAGSAVTLAHAAETSGGPVRFEAHHTAQCVVLHDTARCAQCQFDATRMASPAARQPSWLGSEARRLPAVPVPDVFPARRSTSTALSRAPPLVLS